MRVPDELRDSVAFVCVDSPRGLAPIGTAFFIGVPIEGHPDTNAVLTVTAPHVLAKALEQGYGTVSLRMNAKPGQPTPMVLTETKIDEWLMHPDGTEVANPYEGSPHDRARYGRRVSLLSLHRRERRHRRSARMALSSA